MRKSAWEGTLSIAGPMAILMAMAVVPSGAARAQAGAAAGNDAGGYGDIVVTARRRSEVLSDVPTSIAALDAATLQEKMIASEQDLQRAVPGLVVRESLTQHQISFVIRGQTFDPFSSSPPAVLPYYNEVPMMPVGANDLFDLESVQVLKGPQGTLFGRNTTGGAVLFGTAKPKNEFGGYVTGRIGNRERREVEGAIDLPLISDTVLLRIAGKYKRSDGYVRNLMLDTKLGGQKAWSGRATLVLKPTDSIESTTMFQYSRDRGSSVGGVLYSINACGSPGLNTGPDCAYGPANDPFFSAYVAANPGLFPGGLSEYLDFQKGLGTRKVYHNSPSYYRANAKFLTNSTTIDLGGDLVLKNVAGWHKSFLYESMDVDGSPYPIFNYGPVGNSTGKKDWTEMWSEELQLQGQAADGNLQYILGGFYSHSSQEQFNPQTFFGFEPLAPALTAYLANVRKTKSKALFAQATYKLDGIGLKGLSLTAGYRNTWDKVSLRQLPTGVFFGLPDLSKKFSGPSWQLGIDYKPNDDLMFYIVHRGSWRGGGFNAFSSPAPGTGFDLKDGIEFRKEKVKDVEIGMKFAGLIGGARAHLNIAGYYQVTKNVQRNLPVDLGSGPGSATVNVPEAKVKGVEIDADIKPSEWLMLGGNLAYTNAKFTKNQSLVVGNLVSFGPFPDTPEWSMSAFADVALPLDPSIGRVSLRGDVFHQTKVYFSSLHNTIIPNTQLPAYTLANFRASWADIMGSRVSAALFMNNAFDEKYYTGGLAMGALFGLNIATPGRPRSYGVELGYKF